MKKILLHTLFPAIISIFGLNNSIAQCTNPAPPSANNITVDCGDPATLNASGSSAGYAWFGDSNGNISIGSGNSLSLGNIYADTTVYVAANSGSAAISDSLVFNNAGSTGANGPSQAQVNSSYTGTNLDGLVTVTGGIQQWTVPSTGTYIIDVYGAEGGTSYGGQGAYQSGEFTLNAGDVLNILVGQMGTNTGAGGGSFVVDQSNNPLIIAGGGGAGVTGNWSQSGGTTTNDGNSGCLNNAPINNGGNGGGAGGADNCSNSGGGGGFSGSATGFDGGQSFLAGGAGGSNGGFGGGGGNRGGGGGYSGGGSGGCGGGPRVGGGGGSFNAGSNTVSIGDFNSGHGLVVIKSTPCLSNLVPVTAFVNGPQDPTANSINIDCGDPATLTASGSTGNYTWFDDANGTNSIGTGNSISLGNLYADSTVYVAASTGTGPTTTIYSEDWQSGNGGWTLGNSGPYWNRISAGTGSVSTGPNGGSNNGTPTNGNFYVYLETSTGAGTAYLTGPGFTINGNATLEFSYHMYGATMGTLGVEIFDGTNWTQVWSLSGQQQTSSAQAWTDVSIPLTGYSGAINVRFSGLKGSSYTGDMAIDDVIITETQPGCLSDLVAVTADVNGPQDPTANNINVDCGDPATLTASGSTGNYEWFSDANGNNSIGTGNSLSLGNIFADSTVYVAATSSTVSSCAPETETFDNTTTPVGWSSSNSTGSTAANASWKYGGVLGYNMNPTNDNTGNGGSFAWVDGSTPYPIVVTLNSPTYPQANYSTLSFYMKRAANTTITNYNDVSVDFFDGSSWNNAVFTHNTSTAGSDWEQFTINLTGFSITGPVQFRFNVDKNGTPSPFYDDVAIDDIELSCGGVSSSYCLSDLIQVTADVNGPQEPTANNTNVDCGDPATLTASGSTGNYEWFSDANGTNSIGTGNSLSLGSLYADSTVYVAASTGTGSSTTIYSEDWQSGNGGWTLGNSGPYWNRISAGTGSISTGPNGGSNNGTPTNGNFYVYLETSTGAGTAYLTGPGFTINGNATLEFSYHMYGATMGTLGVEIFDGTNWTQVWSLSGQQQASSAQAWTDVSIPLTGYSGAINVRFSGLRGGSYTGDMAVDDIVINESSPGCLSDLVAVTAEVNGPQDPTANNINVDCGDPATLTASGSTGNYEWFSDSTGTNSIGTGNTISLGNIFADTTVYVSANSGANIGAGTYNFTNAGATGNTGPTQTNVNNEYNGTSLENDVTVTGSGIQEWVVPSNGLYQITVAGAQGGGANGGLGAQMYGEINLNAGDVLQIIVGQQGSENNNGVGGGGGSFVTLNNNPLIIAGGGGGNRGAANISCNANTGLDGNGGNGTSASGNGGVNGQPGQSTQRAHGGSGWLANGPAFTQATSDTPAQSFANGGNGGIHNTSPGGLGGFGGGGGSWNTGWRGSGGGGGYSGGGGGHHSTNPGNHRGGGGGSINNGNNQNNIAAANSGNGFVTIESTQSGCESNLVPVTALVNPLTPPTVAASPNALCTSGSATVNASGAPGGATYNWYSDPNGLNQISTGASYTTPNITTSTTYYVDYNASCNSSIAPVTVTVDQPATPPTISGGGTFCFGEQVTLTATGGSVPAGQFSWFENAVTNPSIGTGGSVTVSPNGTTDYIVEVPANGACAAASSNTITVTVPTPDNTLSVNNSQSTCMVNQNGYIHFLDPNGKLIASINSNGQNLGNVTATSYVEAAPLQVQDCASSILTSVLDRHWVITPQFQPTGPVEVVLPMEQNEEQSLVTNANSNANPNDDLIGLSDIVLTKYAGPTNIDDEFFNNCSSQGGDQTLDLFNQNISGFVYDYWPSYTGNDLYASYDINSFSEFWLHGTSNLSPLPVSLTAFNASCENDNFIEVTWETASEMNASHFIVERSRDGVSWSNEHEVDAAGNANTINSYSFEDHNAGIGFEGYYRLRQVDFDGEQTLYGPISVQCDEIKNASMEVFPNPSSGSFTLRIFNNLEVEDAKIVILDVNGKVIHQQKTNINNGITTLLYDQKQLVKGMYYIRVIADGFDVAPKKLVIN